jgi:AcrR family transcriptional regulator
MTRADAVRNHAKILAAAGEVFAEKGASASTEEVARRAGVVVGTVFRHFPTKDDLLRAILKDVLAGLRAEVAELLVAGPPDRALFTLIRRLVEQAAAHRAVVELLADTDPVGGGVGALYTPMARLLEKAQEAGTVRPGIAAAEVLAVTTALCRAAATAGWEPALRERTVALVEAGLRA